MKSLAHHAKRHFHERYVKPHGRRAHLVLSIDLALVATILTLLGIGGYFAFLYKPLRDDFRFEVVTPEPIVAGRETTVTLKLSNVGKVRIHNVRIEAKLPAHFRVAKMPEGFDPVTGMTKVSTIAPKQSIELKMTGTIYGPPGVETVFVHMLASDDHGAPDEKLFSVKVRWEENLVKGALAFPARIVANQNFPVRYTVTNGTAQRFDDVSVTPHFPANFVVAASSPPIAKGSIIIGALDAGASATVEVFGRYKGKAEDFNASFETFWNEGGAQILIERSDVQRTSIDVNLTLAATFANGGSVFAPGDAVPVKIAYKNDSAYALRDVRFSVDLDPNLFDAKTPQLNFDPVREIAAGASGEAVATATLKPVVSRYVTNPTLSLTPTATFSVSDPEVDATVTGPAISAKISGTAKLALAARYFTSEGEQLGRGPLPPKVGKETRYWILASVATGANTIANGRVEIALPKNVAWTGKQSLTAGNPLAFDASRGVLVWDIGDIAAHAGTTDVAASASFEVALTPEASGIAPALANAATFTGVDTWTDTNLTAKAGAVTTNLAGDAYAQGKGTVKP